MCNKYLILGYFGYHTNQLDGQTVKTRDIYRLVKEEFKESDVKYFDTQDFKYNRLSVLKMLWLVCKCNYLIYLPANNNLRYIFPIIFILSKIFNIKIEYFVVGGWLASYLKTLPFHRWMLGRISGIHVETKRLLFDLELTYKFKNVFIFPNFRFFDFNPKRTKSEKLRLVFMARIMKQKGLDWIFLLADFISTQLLHNDFLIDFYGQINENDRKYFLSNVEKYSFISYKGALQPDEIHLTLSQYDVLLLPTHFYTEGLPGSIVDAYISGIPVIVTEWLNAHEFVENWRSGFIIPFENGEEVLIEKVKQLYFNRQLLSQMQDFSLNKRNQFAPPRRLIHNILKNLT